jgi:hypothetical protein
MQVDVTAVTFRQNEAEATVAFRVRSSPSDARMTMGYTLERKGAGWAVKSRAGSGMTGESTGQMPALPPGHPDISKDKRAGEAK